MTLKRNWPVNAHRTECTEVRALQCIAVNDLDIQSGELIKIDANGLADKVTPADAIQGVSITKKVFEATNETLEKEKVLYHQVYTNNTFAIKVTGATNLSPLVQSDIGKYFTVVSATDHTVDYGSLDSANGQFQLVGILGDNTGEFTIVNKL